MCLVELQGRTEIHGQLVTAGDRLLADARAIALGLGDGVAWVEKVVFHIVFGPNEAGKSTAPSSPAPSRTYS